MIDLICYIVATFCRPFKDTRFRIAFIIFIFTSSFGIYYTALNPANNLGWSDVVTPTSLFSYTVPLMATAIMDGILKAFAYHETLIKGEQKGSDFVTAILLSFLFLLVLFGVLAFSLWHDNVLLSVIGAVCAIVLWVFVNSSNFSSQISNSFDATGSKTPSAANLSNGE